MVSAGAGGVVGGVVAVIVRVLGRGLLQHPVPPKEGLAWVPLVFFKDTREDLRIFCIVEGDTEHRFRIFRAASDTDHHEDGDTV